MDAQRSDDVWRLEAVLEGERPRLVRLCRSLSGNSDAAEDLAQETLVEAWRHRHALHDPTGYAAWLSVVARNVCLRWKRQQWHVAARSFPVPSDQLADLGIPQLQTMGDAGDAVERQELATLLVRALVVLPPPTRVALVERYVRHTAQADIAARLGISEAAVEARLQRGKRTLRRLLTTTLSAEAAAFGLTDPARCTAHETRIWCPHCGQSRLVGHFDPLAGELALGCPTCCPARDGFSWVALPQLFHGVHGVRAALSRQLVWADRYFRDALAHSSAPCVSCARPTRVQLGPPVGSAAAHRNTYGFHLRCESCTNVAWISRAGLVLDLPIGRRFWREHQRIVQCPDRELVYGGRPAVLTTYQALRSRARLEVLTVHDTLELLQVDVTPGA